MRKSIRNYELRIRRVKVAEDEAAYGKSIREPDDVAEVARALIGDAAQEHFCVFMLDIRNRIIGYYEAGRGGIDSCPVDPRSVFRTSIAVGASSILIAHNHPSGDPSPSKEDLALTKRLKDGAKLLGLTLLDHVIVTDDEVLSMRERCMM